jgi:hypothetical protein
MSLMVFEPMTSVFEWTKTIHVLDREAIVFGIFIHTDIQNLIIRTASISNFQLPLNKFRTNRILHCLNLNRYSGVICSKINFRALIWYRLLNFYLNKQLIYYCYFLRVPFPINRKYFINYSPNSTIK